MLRVADRGAKAGQSDADRGRNDAPSKMSSFTVGQPQEGCRIAGVANSWPEAHECGHSSQLPLLRRRPFPQDDERRYIRHACRG